MKELSQILAGWKTKSDTAVYFKIEMDEQLLNKGFLTNPTVEKFKSSWPMNASPENMLDN
jgi:hypothetical protein